MNEKTICPNCKSLGFYKCPSCNGARETEKGMCVSCVGKGLKVCPCKGR